MLLASLSCHSYTVWCWNFKNSSEWNPLFLKIIQVHSVYAAISEIQKQNCRFSNTGNTQLSQCSQMGTVRLFHLLHCCLISIHSSQWINTSADRSTNRLCVIPTTPCSLPGSLTKVSDRWMNITKRKVKMKLVFMSPETNEARPHLSSSLLPSSGVTVHMNSTATDDTDVLRDNFPLIYTVVDSWVKY